MSDTTVQAIADEFGVDPDVVGHVGGLKAWSPSAVLPSELADRLRNELAAAGYHATPRGDDPLAANVRAEAESAPQATSALDTYEPSALVDAAIDAMVHQTTELARRPALALVATGPLMVVASAVVLADLVEKGVAPFAEAPGVLVDSTPELSRVLTDWVARRAASVAMANLRASIGLRGGDTTIIAILTRLFD